MISAFGVEHIEKGMFGDTVKMGAKLARSGVSELGARIGSKPAVQNGVQAIKSIPKPPKLTTTQKVVGATALSAGGVAGVAHFNKPRQPASPFSKSAFGVEVSKLGPPKVKYQQLNGVQQKGPRTTTVAANHVDTHYTGKSAILRRPKYQAVAYPKTKEKMTSLSASRNVTVRGNNAKRLVDAHNKKSSKVTLIGGGKIMTVSHKTVSKSAFGVDHGEISKGTKYWKEGAWESAKPGHKQAASAQENKSVRRGAAAGLVAGSLVGHKINGLEGALSGAATGGGFGILGGFQSGYRKNKAAGRLKAGW